MGYFRPLSQTKFINDANLVSYWKLDGNSNDSKGSNNGTDTSMSYSAGQFDSAGVFNGTSSVINCGNNASLNLSSVATIVSWFKVDSFVTGSNFYLVSKGYNGPTECYYLSLDVDGSGNKSLNFGSWQGVDHVVKYNFTTQLTTGVWYQVAGVWNGTTKKIYVNGIEVATANETTNFPVNTIALTLGAWLNGTTPSRFYPGSIDDTAIFSRALSAGEVAELYQSMTLGEYLPNSNTKLLLHLNGSSADSSGNSNGGTDTAITYSQANGKFGQGAGFNGSSSKIFVPAVNYISATAFTLSCWFKTTFNGTGVGQLVTNDGTVGRNWQFCYENDTHKIRFTRFNSSNGVIMGITSSNTVNDGNWHSAICVFNSSIGSKIYIDGVEKATDSTTTANNVTANQTTIGSNKDSVELYNDSIDEVFIENVAWTPQQVQKYYTMAKGRFGIM